MRKIATILATGIGLAATSAHAELVPVGDNGFVTRHTALVATPPEGVWAVLVEPASWWNGAHSFSGDAQNLTLDARAGGCFCEMLPAGEDRPVPGSVRHMEVIFADPGTAMRLSGTLGPLQSEPVGAVMTITLKAVDGGTRILFEYVVGGTIRFDRDKIGAAVDSVIGEQLSRLAQKIGPLDTPPASIELPASSVAEDPIDATATPADEVPAASPAADDRNFGADFLDDVDHSTDEAEKRTENEAQVAGPLDEFDTR
ncbi:SRPBCC family protein [Croceicoccus bisphenolivorans]|uniref:SRPBCC family protein n=1 Tax=Croceicoccus bisphenolivorans TaxID=1783232 RepID=UPI00082DC701|nr:SRPBCC domain-containing protein [Croceicoccus bisphenolivorans]